MTKCGGVQWVLFRSAVTSEQCSFLQLGNSVVELGLDSTLFVASSQLNQGIQALMCIKVCLKEGAKERSTLKPRDFARKVRVWDQQNILPTDFGLNKTPRLPSRTPVQHHYHCCRKSRGQKLTGLALVEISMQP